MSEPKKERELTPVAPNRMMVAESGRNIHLITAESGEFTGDFEKPEFYAHVAKNFQPFDHIELRTDDQSYWAEYLILACERNWAKVVKLREIRLAPVEEVQVSPEYKVQWKGPHKKFCVLRLKDDEIIHEGAQERGMANLWLEGYIRTIGRKAA